jgi:hypothetical protein
VALRFTITRILPSLLVFVGLLAAALVTDLALHLAGALAVGRYLGLVGATLILASFGYSLRKRRVISVGQPKRLLQAHEVMGWLGTVAVLIHGGVHFNAWLPWLALGSLLVVVASGLTGKYLLAQARESLARRERELAAAGRTRREADADLLAHALLVAAMQRWRKVHMPLTMIFAALASIHVVASLLFWRWS